MYDLAEDKPNCTTAAQTYEDVSGLVERVSDWIGRRGPCAKWTSRVRQHACVTRTAFQFCATSKRNNSGPCVLMPRYPYFVSYVLIVLFNMMNLIIATVLDACPCS